MEVEKIDDDTLVIEVAEGAPYNLDVSLSAVGGTLSGATATISGGSLKSEEITVYTDSTADPVGVSVLSATFSEGYTQVFFGISLVAGSPETFSSTTVPSPSPSPSPTPTVNPSDADVCDRTPAVRDEIISAVHQKEIEAKGEGISPKSCGAITEVDLLLVDSMWFSPYISFLKPGDFLGLDSLVELRLTGVQLNSLPVGIFDNLSRLEKLYLDSNNLSALPNDVFDELTSLKELSLYHNNLSSLPADALGNLTRLEDLYLGSNSLGTLPEGVFENLTRLERLGLSNNDLSTLSSEVFENLSSLTRLHLEGNSLTTLPDGLFDGVSELEQLHMLANPGAPFSFSTILEQQSDGSVVVKVDEGSPFEMSVTLSAEGGTLSDTDVTIEAGDTASDAIAATPSSADHASVTVSLVSAEFDEDAFYSGIQTDLGTPLTLSSPTSVTEPAPTSTCVQPLDGKDEVSESWDDSCLSEKEPLHGEGDRYARFYTFTLDSAAEVTISLKSDEDAYLYLLDGHGKTGKILHEHDDIVFGSDTDSEISVTLQSGDYTIEATTYYAEKSGDFTLTVAGLTDGSES